MHAFPRSTGWVAILTIALFACKKRGGEQRPETNTVPAVASDAAAPTADSGPEFADKLNPVLEAIGKVGDRLPPRITRGYLKLDKDKDIDDVSEFVHAEDMNMLEYRTPGLDTYKVRGSGLFLSCARIIKKKDPPVTEPREKLERCSKAEYLIVIRTKKFDEPKSHSGVQFVGGKVEGDVLVYALSGMKLLGGYPYSAQSSDRVQQGEFEKDMQQNWAKAMADGLKKLQPNTKLSFGF